MVTSLIANEGGVTLRVAEAVPPTPPSVELTLPVVLFFAPKVLTCTFTVKVHVAPPVKVAPERLTLPEPSAAVIVPPPQLPVRPLGVATIIPDGRLSIKPIPVSVLLFGLPRVKLNVVEPLGGTDTVPKALLMVGGATGAHEAALVRNGS